MLSSYRSSSGDDGEKIGCDEQGISNFFPSGNTDVENKKELLKSVLKINAAMPKDISKQYNGTDIQLNIHELCI